MRSTKHFMLKLIVYNCGAVILMKSTQRRYRIKRRKIHIFLHWENLVFNPRMFSFFITLLLKTDPELKNEDIMVREVKRLFLSQHSGCVRLRNPDLDFENLNPDFPIEREIRKRISPPRNPSSGWISIKKSKSGFFRFPFLSFDWEIRKRIC